MDLKTYYFFFILVFMGYILEIKSDTSQLPYGRHSINPVADEMEERRVRQQIINQQNGQLPPIVEQVLRMQHAMTEQTGLMTNGLRQIESIQGRTENEKQITNQLKLLLKTLVAIVKNGQRSTTISQEQQLHNEMILLDHLRKMNKHFYDYLNFYRERVVVVVQPLQSPSENNMRLSSGNIQSMKRPAENQVSQVQQAPKQPRREIQGVIGTSGFGGNNRRNG